MRPEKCSGLGCTAIARPIYSTVSFFSPSTSAAAAASASFVDFFFQRRDYRRVAHVLKLFTFIIHTSFLGPINQSIRWERPRGKSPKRKPSRKTRSYCNRVTSGNVAGEIRGDYEEGGLISRARRPYDCATWCVIWRVQ